MPTKESLLSVRDLACRRGERLLFRHLNFELQGGELLWIRGRNGCGKTSLLRLLAGLSQPAAGTVLRRDGAASSTAFVGHHNALKEDLTVLESLQFLQQLQGSTGHRQACEEGLRALGLQTWRHAPVRTLSQGQRRRAALARLFIPPSASLWILDEPFDALDAQASDALNQALSGHARAGGAVVLTSHLDLCVHEPPPISLQLDQAAFQ
ncbi:MAG: cytochrome c biogenesis heme-transporting ATPase CcmA [Burkholderiales bacterium]